MAKKVSKVYLRGSADPDKPAVFVAAGDRYVVPEGKHDIDVFLAKFPKEDRIGVALIAQKAGVDIVYESTIVPEPGDVSDATVAAAVRKAPFARSEPAKP